MIDIRCSHNHTIEEHPDCFVTGKVIDNRKELEVLKPWYQEEGYRIGYIDIETDGLDTDFATMLTWCIKEKDGRVAYGVITKQELFDEIYDKRLISDLLLEMKKYKILVGYYSGDYRFDIPFIRTKALHYGLEFPGYKLEKKKNGGTKFVPSAMQWDLYPVVKAKLNLRRNSLDAACDYLGIEGKTPISRNDWRKAKYGNPDSLQVVLSHNIGDVIITEELHNKLTEIYKWGRTGI